MTPLFWSEVGDKEILRPKIIQDTAEGLN